MVKKDCSETLPHDQLKSVPDARLTVRLPRELVFKLNKQIEKERKARNLIRLSQNDYLIELILSAVKK